MPDTVQSPENPGTLERRLHPRKQLLFPWIKLGADNGGLILDISEGGLGIQAVRSLADGEFPAMHFQLSESQTSIETRGRISWIGASKHRAGVEFIGLPEEARNKIRQWIPLRLHPSGSVEENPLGKKIEPVKDTLPIREPESAVFVPGTETTGRIDEHQSRHSSIAKDPTGVLPSTAETQDAETISPHIRDKSANPTVAQNVRHKTSPALYLSYQKTTSNREISNRGRRTGSRKPGRPTGLTLVTTVLLVAACFFVGYRFHRTGNGSQGSEVRAAPKAADYSSDSSTSPTDPSIDPKPPLSQQAFVLQVGAMTHQENAEALAVSLHEKNYPAFVSRPGTDRFYRVLVGPFSDVDSTLRVKEQLKEQGFDAFRTPWSPPSAQQVPPL
jgi:cell division protein FtsN